MSTQVHGAPGAPGADSGDGRRGTRIERLRAALSLPTLRRATGLLDGRHKSVFVGRGQDFDDMSFYRPGDDISDIDWKSSARLGQPVIKRYQRESMMSLQRSRPYVSMRLCIPTSEGTRLSTTLRSTRAITNSSTTKRRNTCFGGFRSRSRISLTYSY